MNERFYSGVGSRQTPLDVLVVMTRFASLARSEGFWLRSGHAAGADQAFAKGAGSQAAIFLPWESFNGDVPIAGRVTDEPTEEAFEMAEDFHPAWHRLSDGARAMHARNCHQVLGISLKLPSSFLICWAPLSRGEPIGGTAQAIRIANHHGVPVHNLVENKQMDRIRERLARADREQLRAEEPATEEQPILLG